MSRHSYRCIAVFAVLGFITVHNVTRAANDRSAPSEKQLIETLRSGAPAEKAIACKQLAIHGSKAAVPELAKLLADEQTASWSRIALEAIPDPSADAALLEAAKTLKGQLLVGTINSIGVRRSDAAVDVPGRAVKGQGCGSGIGVGGGARSTSEMRKRRTHFARHSPAHRRPFVRQLARDAFCVPNVCLAVGKRSQAAEIYDQVRECRRSEAAQFAKPRAAPSSHAARRVFLSWLSN